MTAAINKRARGGAASATPGETNQRGGKDMPRQPADVDPRVAATGGYRRNPTDPKSNYEWPGMMPLPAWQRTRIHQHSTYFCAKCGRRLGSPQAVYTHLAKVHPAAGSRPARARVAPSEASATGNGRIGPQLRLIAVDERMPTADRARFATEAAFAVPCPVCGVQPGKRCVTRKRTIDAPGYPPPRNIAEARRFPHPERLAEAEVASVR